MENATETINLRKYYDNILAVDHRLSIFALQS
jgi:hypothetical protein